MGCSPEPTFDGSLVRAVEVGGAWWGVGEGEVGLALLDDLGLVFFCLVDDGLVVGGFSCWCVCVVF